MFAALGCVGAGAIVIWPDEKWIGWGLIGAAVLIFLFGIKIDHSQFRVGRPRILGANMNPYLLVMGISALVFMGALAAYVVDRNRGSTVTTPPLVPSATIAPPSNLSRVVPKKEVPNGMTLHPSPGSIQLTFKSSPLFTEPIKQRIITDVTRFRDYLIQLRIPVPIDLPPVGTQPEGMGMSMPPGLPIYRGDLRMGNNSVEKPKEATRLYCEYVIEKILLGNDSPLQPAFGEPPATDATAIQFIHAISISKGLSQYLNSSFWNQVEESHETPWSLATVLWDLHEKFGREFTDKLVGYTLKIMIDEPVAKFGIKVNEYFIAKLRIGASIIDNDGSRWPEIEMLLRKHEFMFHQAPLP